MKGENHCISGTSCQKPCVNFRLRDLPEPAIACVECEVEKGVAVLTSCHLETLAADIDDGDPLVEDMVPVLRQHDSRNMAILRYLLHRLHVKVL